MAESGSVQNDSERFRTVPNASEPFGTVRNDAEGFRSVPHVSERKQSHTLTVREAAKMFEAAGVARTERSIVNWCQPNRTGIARLDSYLDPNERRYYISAQSVELAIAEEKANAAKNNEPSETFGSVPNAAERTNTGGNSDRAKDWESKVRDLEITNRAIISSNSYKMNGPDFLINCRTWMKPGAPPRTHLRVGFRHFDCAERYRNEREMGESLAAEFAMGAIAREDVIARPTVTFINLDQAGPNSPFTAVIFQENVSQFGDVQKLQGKRAEISGTVTEYRGKPEIILEATNQVRVAK
jgi:hypothetical protein